MPIFEFECRTCRAKTTALVLVRERVHEVRCRRCGGADLQKLYSRFATPRSDEARMEAMAGDPALADIDENDPASFARAMQRMGREMGEDLGENFEEAFEQEMAGSGPPGGESDPGEDGEL
jgi:putative FmdB family regulatory protein